MAKKKKVKELDVVMYTEDDCGNGNMQRVQVKNLVELFEEHFPDFNIPELEEGEKEHDEDMLKQDFENWCGENNNQVMVFDIKKGETIIGYR